MSLKDVLSLPAGEQVDLAVCSIFFYEKMADVGFGRFKPSRDIAAAMLVADQLDEFYLEKNGDGYMVMTGLDWETAQSATFEELPLAICRVALMARGA